jgi:hypothetical protein
MKKQLLKTLVIVAAIVLVSCSKDDDKPSKTDLLTAKSWSTTKYEMKGSDVTADYRDACNDDDISQFLKDGSYKDDIGTVKCYDGDTNSSGTWKWLENETILQINYPGDDPYDWKLLQLTSTTVKISIYDADEDGDLILTLTAK